MLLNELAPDDIILIFRSCFCL